MLLDERLSNHEEALRTAMSGALDGTWTAIPGIIDGFSASNMTVSVQPAIRLTQRMQDGTEQPLDITLLVDVPVYFPGGGGFSLTFPIKAGDECLVVFCSRSIDAWHQSGGVQTQIESRTHDLSDGMAFVGFRSAARQLSGISTTATQLRSDDGNTKVTVADGTITLKAPTGVIVDTPLMTITGAITAQNVGGAANAVTMNGTLRTVGGDLIADGIGLKTHHHVAPSGGGNTGSAIA